ncbi:MAG: hypothetical protein ACKVT0_17185 [Planctomycetaceae bacterium]
MITFAEVEQLKKDLTDRYVVVQDGIPELRRFQGRTGFIKTVNMSGRALVQFDGSEDIAWYDIEPTYLKVVTAPVAKTAEKKGTGDHAPAADQAAVVEKKPVAAKPAGKSPLEMARAQGAAGAAKAAESPATAGGTPKKLSPLELARQQGAAGAAKAAPVKSAPAAPAAEKQAAAASPAPGKKLSPLELARQQGAAGSASKAAAPPQVKAPAAAPVEVAKPVVPEASAPAPKPAAASGGSVKTPGTTAEIIALARQQGAVK